MGKPRPEAPEPPKPDEATDILMPTLPAPPPTVDAARPGPPRFEPVPAVRHRFQNF